MYTILVLAIVLVIIGIVLYFLYKKGYIGRLMRIYSLSPGEVVDGPQSQDVISQTPDERSPESHDEIPSGTDAIASDSLLRDESNPIQKMYTVLDKLDKSGRTE